ncbi:MAG: hypothetical protein VYC34_04260, partial [Planctomycetota bacterium]|nr:hypothetical protein [Planctomycetota bacterium]
MYLEVAIGGIKHTRLILARDIASIERDEIDSAADAAMGGNGERTPGREAVSSNATRVAFLTLEGSVGSEIHTSALEEAVALLEDDDVDILVLRMNSGGGSAEMANVSEFIQDEIKPEYRVVGWVESAISAAAFIMFTLEDMYMMSEGNIGGAVGFSQQGGRAKALEGEGLEWSLRFGETVSRRGNRDPRIMRAMQVFMTLSCDIDAAGNVTWYDDNSGRYIVSRENQILTLNSQDAVRYGVARAIADTREELMEALGVREWVEVGQDANAHMRSYREAVATAQVRINELLQKMQIALEAGQGSRARRFLGEIRSWVNRAPALEDSMGLTPDWFREQERRIDEMTRSG